MYGFDVAVDEDSRGMPRKGVVMLRWIARRSWKRPCWRCDALASLLLACCSLAEGTAGTFDAASKDCSLKGSPSNRLLTLGRSLDMAAARDASASRKEDSEKWPDLCVVVTRSTHAHESEG